MESKEFYCVGCNKYRKKDFMINKSSFGKHICVDCELHITKAKRSLKKHESYSESRRFNSFVNMVTKYD